MHQAEMLDKILRLYAGRELYQLLKDGVKVTLLDDDGGQRVENPPVN